jgi:Holliday junction resolvasome RuvABC ATP-dependent DNA helicase subunit
MNAILQGFVDDYKARGVPPPYFLLVGKDDEQNASIVREFAHELGSTVLAVNGSDVNVQGDLTTLLTNKMVAFISNVQKLRGHFVEWLSRALHRRIEDHYWRAGKW